MTGRAVAWVALIALLGCPQKPMVPCGPGTCSGCCSPAGVCNQDNGADATCGQPGTSCVDCTHIGQHCVDATTCGGDLGGGAGGGGVLCNTACGPGTCNPCTSGCCFGNICSSCGGAGGDVVPANGVDNPCTFDSDCRTVDTTLTGQRGEPGGPALCQVIESATHDAYPDGYCTRRCDDDLQCGFRDICGTFGGTWGEALSICYHGCDFDSDCTDINGLPRPGYVCHTFDKTLSPSGVCLPSNFVAFDAGPPPGRFTAGSACTQDSDCQQQTPWGHCITATLGDAGDPTGFTDGYCAIDCTMTVSDAWCMGLGAGEAPDGGAVCAKQVTFDVNFTPFVTWQCVAGCDPPCRSGYFCNNSLCEPDCSLGTLCSGCQSAQGCDVFGSCDPMTHGCFP
jgi:hypothetical protein